MQWSDIPFSPSSRTLRQFGFLCSIALGAFGIWRGVQTNAGSAIALFSGAVVLGAVAGIRPQALRPIYVGWLVVLFPISWLVSNLILASLFYGLITPFACSMRLSGRDILTRRRQPERETYWVPKNVCCESNSYFRQF